MPVRIQDLPALERLRALFVIKGGQLVSVSNGEPQGREDRKGYLRVRVDGRMFMVHRIVYALHHGILPPPHVQIDHVDRDSLNNNPDNLRACAHVENVRHRKGNVSRNDPRLCGMKGVHRAKRQRWFVAMIFVGGKKILLGNFSTVREAAVAYNQAATRYHGEFAYLNDLSQFDGPGA